MDRNGKIGVIVLCLFATPFALFGLFALEQAWRTAMGAPGNVPFWYPLIFGLVFSVIGFGLMFVALTGGKRYARQQRMQLERPAEPWLWRADWAQGRVNSNTRGNMISSWVFAILWNLVSAPVAWLVVPAAARQRGPVVFLALVFPALGLFLLIRAIRQTLASFEFGKTYFEMASVPGVIGRELKGTIQARFPHSPDHGVHLRISSAHRVTTSSGNSQTTTESILWRDEADLASEQLCAGPMGTTIPVSFRIPCDAHPTEEINPRDEYVWLLEALADVPGVNYHDIFEVPVFRTAATPTETEATADRAGFFGTAAPAPHRPEHLTVEVRESTEGTEFYFPAARNKCFAASTTFFAVIFSGVTFFLIHFRTPFIFPLSFGFFSLLIDYIAATLWLGTTRVVIGNSLKLRAGMLGGGRVKEMAFSDIASIYDKITAQQGGGTGTPYYDIEMKLRNGRSVTLGSTLSSKREAEWLVSEMNRLAGLQTRALGAVASS
jgi:hypothetical protein